MKIGLFVMPIGLRFLKYDPSIPDEDVTPEYMMENY